jgi:hypothetical protein
MSNQRLSAAELKAAASDEVLNILRYELDKAVAHYLRLGAPVYLERLGIIFPTTKVVNKVRTKGRSCISWRETFRSLAFEKCLELSSSTRKTHSHLIELKEITNFIFPRLPEFITSSHNIRAIRKLLLGWIDYIKRELIESGASALLASSGQLYALHNRQGKQFSEWFAGADLFIKSSVKESLGSSQQIEFERPVLEKSWEIFDSAYGACTTQFVIDTTSSLNKLGFDASDIPPSLSKINVHGYTLPDQRLLFVTDGFRSLALNSCATLGRGNEIIIQLKERDVEIPSDSQALADFFNKIFASAILIAFSNKSRLLKIGSAISLEESIFPTQNGTKRDELNATLINVFSSLTYEQLAVDGAFNFVNLLVISEDEKKVAEEYSSAYLMQLLEHRGLHQTISLKRPSILLRTALSHHITKNTKSIKKIISEESRSELISQPRDHATA